MALRIERWVTTRPLCCASSTSSSNSFGVRRISTSPRNAGQFMRVFHEIDVVALLPRVTCPILQIHGRQDTIVPWSLGDPVRPGTWLTTDTADGCTCANADDMAAALRGLLRDDEVVRVRDVVCTTPLRTAFDLARGSDLEEAVIAVDRLANRHRFQPERLRDLCERNRGRRGVARVPRVLQLAGPYAGSPLETRLRLLIVAGGLPCPSVQWAVQDVATRSVFWLDLAWPELKIGIEYDGEPHTEPARVLRDVGRTTRLVDLGWRLYRYTKRDVFGDPARIIADLTRGRARST